MRKRATLNFQLIVTMTLIVTGTVLLCWFLSNTFLERFYSYNKQKDLIRGYEMINDASNKDTIGTDSFAIAFERLCTTKNVNIMVIGERREVILSSAANELQFQLQLAEMIMGMDNRYREEIVIAENYSILRQTDRRMQSEYLILFGELENGNYIYMKTAVESIHEIASITSNFFLWSGVGAAIIGIIVIFLVSNSITSPIREISGLSKKMSSLDFDAKFVSRKHSSREIDELGVHMNELSETLEKTISELKAANNELQNDIRKKEQIDFMRREFLSNVSHELKTPLALISGYAEGLKECINDTEESRDFYCEVIMDESDKMNRMVQKLLTLNQLEFGNDVVEMSRFDITEVVRGVVDSTSLLTQTEGIRLVFEEQGPVYVWGDEFKVEEVMTNYLSNAIHYAEGEKCIRVFFERRDQLLRVNVYNSGNRIPEDELDKVWIKFYKVDKARTREYGGSGIGLSIVKAIMDSLHRECGVYNVEDGVVFWMELDCKTCEEYIATPTKI